MFKSPKVRRLLSAHSAIRILTAILLLAPSTCLSASTEQKLKVVATTGMIGDMVKTIAGEAVDVRVLIGPGVDPHLFKATRSDIALLSSADAIFSNGLLLEGKLQETFDRFKEQGKAVIEVASELASDELIMASDVGKVLDPHIWMDPLLWAKTIPLITASLTRLVPIKKAEFAQQADKLMLDLNQLDGYAKQVFATVEKEKRVLITAHDAFRYFGRRYGIEVLGIQGISTESEAGVTDIERIVNVLVGRKIGAVFVESTVSERNVRALIEGARARGQNVKIGAKLYSDAMGENGTYEGTYFGMLDHNITRIVEALGGRVPKRGFRGQLSEGN